MGNKTRDIVLYRLIRVDYQILSPTGYSENGANCVPDDEGAHNKHNNKNRPAHLLPHTVAS